MNHLMLWIYLFVFSGSVFWFISVVMKHNPPTQNNYYIEKETDEQFTIEQAKKKLDEFLVENGLCIVVHTIVGNKMSFTDLILAKKQPFKTLYKEDVVRLGRSQDNYTITYSGKTEGE